MGHAVQLNFDKQTTAKIKKLWTSLKYHNICDFMVKNSVEPHITLFVFTEDITAIEEDLQNTVMDYFSSVNAFDINIPDIGVLPNDANIVLLNLLVTEQLLEVHRKLYEVLEAKGYAKYIIEKCKPGNWMPYITMTMNINETDMIDAIKLLKRKFKPLTATLSSASFLGFYPIVYKANKALG